MARGYTAGRRGQRTSGRPIHEQQRDPQTWTPGGNRSRAGGALMPKPGQRGANRTRLHLVRHGLVDKAWNGRLYGCLDVPLSDLGRDQARVAAQRLRIGPTGAEPAPVDLIVHSGLERAAFGAEAIAETLDMPAQPRIERDLRELDRGDWAGLKAEELEERSPGALDRWYAEPDRNRPPGGENLDDLASRVLPVLDRLAAEQPGGEVALVAHGWVVRVALLEALGLPRSAATRLRVPPASIHTVDWPCQTAPGGQAAPILIGLDADQPRQAGRGWYAMPPRPTRPHPKGTS